MKRWTSLFAGAVASIGAAAGAQMPAAPPPPADSPPVAPATGQAAAGEVAAMPMSAPAVSGPCTPGHCTHRLAFARRRCRRHLQEVFLGYPEEFERPPLGAMLHANMAAQVGNAEAAAMIVRPYDFEPGTARLNLRGGDRLREIAAKLPTSFAPVVVERSRDAALDRARRAAVLAALGSGPFPIPPERVIVGPSTTTGLDGFEAILINGTELTRTEMMGPPVGAAVAPSTPGSDR